MSASAQGPWRGQGPTLEAAFADAWNNAKHGGAEPNKEYKIITRQSPTYLSANIQKDGRVKGDLHVTSPAFWDAGKYLILVRD